jgi:hypothetical protein
MVLVPAGEFVMGSDADEIEGLLRQYSTLRRDRNSDVGLRCAKSP